MEFSGLWMETGGPAAVILLGLVFAAILVFLAVWVALPFAVFGTKSLLRDLVAAQRETNRKLDEIHRALAARGSWRPALWPDDEGSS
ncbi:MAG: hypothetical protein Kow0092_35320 [Deferrisomatales bacterium]